MGFQLIGSGYSTPTLFYLSFFSVRDQISIKRPVRCGLLFCIRNTVNVADTASGFPAGISALEAELRMIGQISSDRLSGCQLTWKPNAISWPSTNITNCAEAETRGRGAGDVEGCQPDGVARHRREHLLLYLPGTSFPLHKAISFLFLFTVNGLSCCFLLQLRPVSSSATRMLWRMLLWFSSSLTLGERAAIRWSSEPLRQIWIEAREKANQKFTLYGRAPRLFRI